MTTPPAPEPPIRRTFSLRGLDVLPSEVQTRERYFSQLCEPAICLVAPLMRLKPFVVAMASIEGREVALMLHELA